MEDIKTWLESYRKIETEVREYERIITKEAGRYVGILDAMQAHRDELEKRAEAIKTAINNITDPTQRTLLRGVYLEGKTAQQMAPVIGYSEIHTYRILKQALEMIEATQKPTESPQKARKEKKIKGPEKKKESSKRTTGGKK